MLRVLGVSIERQVGRVQVLPINWFSTFAKDGDILPRARHAYRFRSPIGIVQILER